MRFATLSILLTSTLAAQAFPPHEEILTHFGLRRATVQSVSLPKSIGSGFGMQLRLGKDVVTLALTPHDIRAASFKRRTGRPSPGIRRTRSPTRSRCPTWP